MRFSYDRWALNLQFNFRAGNKIVNAARMNAENMYTSNNQSAAVNWRWRVEGDVAPLPRALHKAGYNWLGSDRFVEDGSFMRLNYAQISYSFPASSLKRLGLQSLRFDVNANNLFCLTGYSGADPEITVGTMGVATDNARTPNSRSVTFGMSVGF